MKMFCFLYAREMGHLVINIPPSPDKRVYNFMPITSMKYKYCIRISRAELVLMYDEVGPTKRAENTFL